MLSRNPALASCEDCGREWHGATAAHGLSVLGHCPRCNGTHLTFRDAAATGTVPETASSALEPWQVLGTPTSWNAA